ncbi:hypothetical protein ACQFX9_04045 [Aliinostoc sp. HNIBRCY26]|uniref:hypothetical protein n=1 Tax=Aliinostoc sp. HNIBRCY26 TaxID=3418997 RepID=UPI003D05429A
MWLRRAFLLGIICFCFGINFFLAAPCPQSQSLSLPMPEQNYLWEFQLIELSQLFNLTLEQQQKLAINFYQNQEQILQNQQILQPVASDLITMMMGTATADEIRDKYQQLQNLYLALDNMRFESMLIIREILKPEQRQHLFDMLQPNNPEEFNYSKL